MIKIFVLMIALFSTCTSAQTSAPTAKIADTPLGNLTTYTGPGPVTWKLDGTYICEKPLCFAPTLAEIENHMSFSNIPVVVPITSDHIISNTDEHGCNLSYTFIDGKCVIDLTFVNTDSFVSCFNKTSEKGYGLHLICSYIPAQKEPPFYRTHIYDVRFGNFWYWHRKNTANHELCAEIEGPVDIPTGTGLDSLKQGQIWVVDYYGYPEPAPTPQFTFNSGKAAYDWAEKHCPSDGLTVEHTLPVK